MKTCESRNIAVIYSWRNKPPLKADAVGAFHPEALAFQKYHSVPPSNMFSFDWKEKASIRREKILEHIWNVSVNGPLDGIAFFCHGWPHGIQAGFTRKHIPELTNAINCITKDYLEIVLYACLTAENDIEDNQIKKIGPATKGGFADLLAQRLGKLGIRGHVDAHKKAGHTTWVPYVIRFQNSGIESLASWLVEPNSESWPAWRKAIRKTDMKYRFPFMTELEIKNELFHASNTRMDMDNEDHCRKMYKEVCEKLDKLEALDDSDPHKDDDELHSLRGMARFYEDVLDLRPRKPKIKDEQS